MTLSLDKSAPGHIRAHACVAVAWNTGQHEGKFEEALKVLRRALRLTMADADRLTQDLGNNAEMATAGQLFDMNMDMAKAQYDDLTAKNYASGKFLSSLDGGMSALPEQEKIVQAFTAMAVKIRGLQCDCCAVEVPVGTKFSFCKTCEVCMVGVRGRVSRFYTSVLTNGYSQSFQITTVPKPNHRCALVCDAAEVLLFQGVPGERK